MTRPTVTAGQINVAAWPPPPARDDLDYLSLVLDLKTGSLNLVAHDWRWGRKPYDRTIAPVTINGVPRGFFSVPGKLEWTIDPKLLVKGAGVDAGRAQQLLDCAVPFARGLIDGLVEVSGKGEWDWSVEAVNAVRHLAGLCVLQPPNELPVISMDEVIETAPALVPWDVGWVTGDELEAAARKVAELLHPELPAPAGELAESVPLAGLVVGARAWLYGRRSDQNGRLTLDAAEWFRRHPLTGVTPGADDAALRLIAGAAGQAAVAAGVKVIGIHEAVRAARDALWDRNVPSILRALRDMVEPAKEAGLPGIVAGTHAFRDHVLKELLRGPYQGPSKVFLAGDAGVSPDDLERLEKELRNPEDR